MQGCLPELGPGPPTVRARSVHPRANHALPLPGEPPRRRGRLPKGRNMPDGSMNLTVQRSEKSVWDAPALATVLSDYDQERWLAAAWGSGLSIIGARRGGFAGGPLAAGGCATARSRSL